VRRGELVAVVLKGDYGKPRPALIIQSDLFDAHPSVTIMPVTSELRDTPLFRLDLAPSETNGLRQPSQVMIDKIHTVSRDRMGSVIGRLDDKQMVSVNRLMLVFLGLA
jgi:mRNA interferase MazF